VVHIIWTFYTILERVANNIMIPHTAMATIQMLIVPQQQLVVAKCIPTKMLGCYVDTQALRILQGWSSLGVDGSTSRVFRRSPLCTTLDYAPPPPPFTHSRAIGLLWDGLFLPTHTRASVVPKQNKKHFTFFWNVAKR
jgi:hypothetical protein